MSEPSFKNETACLRSRSTLGERSMTLGVFVILLCEAGACHSPDSPKVLPSSERALTNAMAPSDQLRSGATASQAELTRDTGAPTDESSTPTPAPADSGADRDDAAAGTIGPREDMQTTVEGFSLGATPYEFERECRAVAGSGFSARKSATSWTMKCDRNAGRGPSAGTIIADVCAGHLCQLWLISKPSPDVSEIEKQYARVRATFSEKYGPPTHSEDTKLADTHLALQNCQKDRSHKEISNAVWLFGPEFSPPTRRSLLSIGLGCGDKTPEVYVTYANEAGMAALRVASEGASNVTAGPAMTKHAGGFELGATSDEFERTCKKAGFNIARARDERSGVICSGSPTPPAFTDRVIAYRVPVTALMCGTRVCELVLSLDAEATVKAMDERRTEAYRALVSKYGPASSVSGQPDADLASRCMKGESNSLAVSWLFNVKPDPVRAFRAEGRIVLAFDCDRERRIPAQSVIYQDAVGVEYRLDESDRRKKSY